MITTTKLDELRKRSSYRSTSAQPELNTRRTRTRSPGRSLTDIYTKRTHSKLSIDTNKFYGQKKHSSSFNDGFFIDKSQNLINDTCEPNSKKLKTYANYYTKLQDNFDFASKPKEPQVALVSFNKLEDQNKKATSNNIDKRLIVSQTSLEDTVNPSMFMLFLTSIWKLILNILRIIVILFVIVFSITLYNALILHWCEEDRKLLIPTEDLFHNLTHSVTGQNMAINKIVNEINLFQAGHSSKPLLLWLLGWTGTGKTKVSNIVKLAFPYPEQVQTIHTSLISQYHQNHAHSMIDNLHPCRINLVIIDGWQESSNTATDLLQTFIMQYKLLNLESKLIIMLIGIRGSTEVNKLYIDMRKDTKREFLTYDDLSSTIDKLEETKFLNSLRVLLRPVPFLPLEQSHVKFCILKELEMLEKISELSFDIYKTHSNDDLLNSVMKRINFVPLEQPIVSATGCKRINSLLKLFN